MKCIGSTTAYTICKEERMYKKTFYTARRITDIEFNSCYMGEVCSPATHASCSLSRRCCTQMCEMELRSIARSAGVKDLRNYEVVHKAVSLWREQQYKKCKPFIVEIRR